MLLVVSGVGLVDTGFRVWSSGYRVQGLVSLQPIRLSVKDI